MMRDQRLIAIKNPQLRRFRDALRQIIFLRLKDLSKDSSDQWVLKRPYYASICCCSICTAIDRDMVYDAKTHKWNCTECNKIFILARQKDVHMIVK
jgi:hypothetical protein